MSRRLILSLALAVVMAIAPAAPVSAVTTTWNLGGGGGDLGTTEVFIATDLVTPLTAGGFAFTSGLILYPPFLVAPGDPLKLHQNAQGLGIEGGGLLNCGTLNIDECNPAEYLRGELPSPNWDPVSVTLTNLETSGGNDNWLIFGDTDGDIAGATLLASGDATGHVGGVKTVLLPGNTPFQFLFIRPAVEGDCTSFLTCGLATSRNDDFRVLQVVGEVPEPGTLLLLGAGLAALGGFAARRRRN